MEKFDSTRLHLGISRTILKSLRGCLLLMLGSLVGCGGCQQDPGEKLSKEEMEKRARERRESLEMNALVSLPSDTEAKFLVAKPGHWLETRQQFKSNNEDLQIVAVNGVARGSESVKIPGTNFVNEYTRRTSLPKGQTKSIDLQCFVPFSGVQEDPFAGASTRLTFRTELLSWPLMTPILQVPSLKSANELKEHEYQLVVMSPEALSYKYLGVLDAVYWFGEDLMGGERTRSYQVTLVKPDNNRYSLPKSMLTMTAMAVLVWDDVSPDNLSEDQKRAIVDWLHWGGQIVVNGPSSWARLQNSFLSPYLPAEESNSRDLSTEDFAEISEFWMTQDLNRLNPMKPISIVGESVGGIELKLRDGGSWLPHSGKLVAESQVGRGRIVVTCFPMTDPRIFRWPFYSSFFSTGLLRRHPREIRISREERLPAQFWTAPFQNSERDARLHSNLRILTRDLPLSVAVSKQLKDSESVGVGGSSFEQVTDDQLNLPSGREEMQWGGRGGAWNDYSGLSFQALEALKSAAGIELPSRTTIMYLLAGYLLILVPVNWVVFKIIGRLEYAWVAAPIMALAGAVIVTQVARLDIGFARRTTEISVLELHGDHPRGHLTQYLALYTSLSTNYSVQFPENDSVALPLGDVGRSMRRAGTEQRDLRTNYGRSEGVTLEPLTVYSSSTEMIHAEQMVALEGGLRLGSRAEDGSGPPALRNDTGVSLSATLLVRRTEGDVVEVAWVGELANKQTATLEFSVADSNSLWGRWNDDPITQMQRPTEDEGNEDALWIGGILKELVRKTPLMPGQTRLFAFTNDRLSRLNVSPEEDQYDGRCLVVAHLTPKRLGDLQPDVSIKSLGKALLSEEELEQQVQGSLEGNGESLEIEAGDGDAGTDEGQK